MRLSIFYRQSSILYLQSTVAGSVFIFRIAPMSELIRCPHCNRQLRIPEELVGKTVKCPECGSKFVGLIGGARQREESPWAETEDPNKPGKFAAPEDIEDYEPEEPRLRRRRNYEPHRGITILVLGILAFVVCGPILGPIAWIMGNSDMAKIKSGRMDPAGRDLTNAGRICGMIATLLAIAVCGIYGVGILFVWAGKH